MGGARVEQLVFPGKAHHCVRRPFFRQHLVVRPVNEGIRVGPFGASAAVQTFLLIGGLPGIGVIDFPVLLLALELGGGAAFDFVVYGLCCTSQGIRNRTVGIVVLFQDGDLTTF